MNQPRPNIWMLQSHGDLPALTACLRHPDGEIRRRAALALRALDARQAVPALKAALRAETETQVRSALEAVLRVLDHQTDVPEMRRSRDLAGLFAALHSRQPEHAAAAARALGEIGDRTAVEPLVIVFQDSAVPAKVRLAAAEALLELQSAPAVVTLLGALRRDSWEVRRNAAVVLGQLQATWAVEPLAVALEDPHPIVRLTAAAALRRIGTAEALSALHAHPPGAEPAVSEKPSRQRSEAPSPRSHAGSQGRPARLAKPQAAARVRAEGRPAPAVVKAAGGSQAGGKAAGRAPMRRVAARSRRPSRIRRMWRWLVGLFRS